MEQKYEFRKRLEVVHKHDRRDSLLQPTGSEMEFDENWHIVCSQSSDAAVMHVAKDLQDYLFVSMGISVRLKRTSNLREVMAQSDPIIVLATREELPEQGASLTDPRSYRITVEKSRIVVCGYDVRGVGQGSYFLEDLMNLREAPFLEIGETIRKPIFSPRMVHSGWGLDHFPDAHLNAMAHSGIDAILIFVEDVDKTPYGYLDFNHLVDRAELHGLDVYMYSYLVSRKHPDEPDAESYYDNTYGKVLKACPRFKGVILVGESCEFPSKDPNTTGMLRLEWPKDQPQTKPSPGWWPCTDYPQWLNMLKKVIRKHNTEAEIVFWTYNWGWAPEEDRIKLIRSIPEDITLQVTFEMFEPIQHEHVTHICVDYTASFAGPGHYFSSEAQVARERGLKLYTMANTGGLTWDIGVIPYEPIPFQWARRHTALLKANEDWGLSGLMDSHHFGWWPSFVSDLTKWTYWQPSPPIQQSYEAVARRDYSEEAVPHVLEAWEHWSEGIRQYIPTNEDQYGPFRVGPSYPMVFKKRMFEQDLQIPSSWHAMFGSTIALTNYEPAESVHQSLGISRFEVEIRSLEQMLARWNQGNLSLEQAIELTPERKRVEADRLLGMNRFIVHTVQTVIHLKQWWLLKQRLFTEPDPQRGNAILDELTELAEQEIANAEATIPLVEADSRLGWEPSMDYMTDPEHIRWKIAQVRSVIDKEFADYRKSLANTVGI
jgi:hypothetical protein